ncbi:MAG: hypothetical protein MUC38_12795 [Cyclobacteriaceae bacterium]|jgi:uncharacterized repeat protein (TIGR03806 family)|nr:hypothetical protein [Cyclobacteriaceae bacterium]
MKAGWMRVIVLVVLAACTQKPTAVVVAEEVPVAVDLSSLGKATLSSYGFFEGDLKHLQPAASVIPYELNAPLFSDYAFKKRFIHLPAGKQIRYHATEVLDFPEGTVLIKNFYYPADFRKPDEDKRLLETRLLLLEKGEWQALGYVWNPEQTEAQLDVAGKTLPMQWTHTDGTVRQVNYSVPSINQCKSCHLKGDQIMPIGPSARQLNGRLPGHAQIQLVEWQQQGFLAGLPEIDALPRLAAYENINEPLAERARAWLEINCAHCHRPDGPAKTSGLHLMADVVEGNVLGIGKAPVAAGKGSGGRLYGIVPGRPEESILQYRIESTHPGVMMPEVGRTVVHDEGVALVRAWIKQMKTE